MPFTLFMLLIPLMDSSYAFTELCVFPGAVLSPGLERLALTHSAINKAFCSCILHWHKIMLARMRARNC